MKLLRMISGRMNGGGSLCSKSIVKGYWNYILTATLQGIQFMYQIHGRMSLAMVGNRHTF